MDDLSGMFTENETNAFKILQSLIKPDNISQITELNMKKIRVLTHLRWMSEISKPENHAIDRMQILSEKVIPYYQELLCSLDRKSRKEIVDAIKNMNEKFITENQGLTGGLLGGKK